MKNTKIHIYFMPGMAANPSIFKNIKLPPNLFEQHLLDWFLPTENMNLTQYALKMNERIHHKNVVLIGVSFGGMLVQEMAKFMKVKKIIIISSVKKTAEMPGRLRFARHTKIYKLLPTSWINNIEFLAKYSFGETLTKRLALYEEYLSIRDQKYIDWSIDKIVNWSQVDIPRNLVHIHGENDAVFPIEPN